MHDHVKIHAGTSPYLFSKFHLLSSTVWWQEVIMTDRASQALVESRLLGKPCTYDTIAKCCNVPLSTLHYWDCGRPSWEAKAQHQQYLTPSEEGALEKYVKMLANLGTPMRVKFLSSLALIIARQRSTTNDKAINPQTRTGPRVSRNVIQILDLEKSER
jgi:hypothetical protein